MSRHHFLNITLPSLRTIFKKSFLLLFPLLFFSGCFFDSPPSPPSSQLNTWFTGFWETHDKSGKTFEAKVAPQAKSSTHYDITFWEQGKEGSQKEAFDGWISRVDDLKILTLRSLSSNPYYQGKYLLFHYELVVAAPDPQTGISERRVRLTQLELPKESQHLDSYHLRKAIREALKEQTLLLPEGSSVWVRQGGVTLPPLNK